MSGVLSREYRRSIGRCEARWLAAGVDSELAAELAADPQIGCAVPGTMPTAANPLRVIAAGVGAGKSLIGERAFQAAVKEREGDGAAPVPCWLRARALKAGLENAMLAAIAEIATRLHRQLLLVELVQDTWWAGSEDAPRLEGFRRTHR